MTVINPTVPLGEISDPNKEDMQSVPISPYCDRALAPGSEKSMTNAIRPVSAAVLSVIGTGFGLWPRPI